MARKVPVIDMQKVDGLADELVKACEEWGCFRMVNHGVSMDLMAEMKATSASLFDLPEEVKKRTISSELGMGYVGRNLACPYFEGLSIDDISSPDEFCDRLDTSAHQREIICKYIESIRDLAGLLGRMLMEGSGLTGDLFEGWRCQLRMNKYYFDSESLGSTGVTEHSDPTFLTILQDDEDVNGLQIVDKLTGEFVPFDPIPGTLAVNIGDIGMAWSNGRYCNVKHQVMCTKANTRYSIALFVLGPKDKKVEAPSKLLDSEHPRLYVPIDVEEYRRVRIATRLRTGGALELFNTSTAPA